MNFFRKPSIMDLGTNKRGEQSGTRWLVFMVYPFLGRGARRIVCDRRLFHVPQIPQVHAEK